jgi:hypothetical protein
MDLRFMRNFFEASVKVEDKYSDKDYALNDVEYLFSLNEEAFAIQSSIAIKNMLRDTLTNPEIWKIKKICEKADSSGFDSLFLLSLIETKVDKYTLWNNLLTSHSSDEYIMETERRMPPFELFFRWIFFLKSHGWIEQRVYFYNLSDVLFKLFGKNKRPVGFVRKMMTEFSFLPKSYKF